MELTLQRACEELGLKITTPFSIIVDGKEIFANALVEELGASKGMVIVDEYEKLQGFGNELVEMGYGYSTLSQEGCNLSDYIEMFRDWGWACKDKAPPEWIE